MLFSSHNTVEMRLNWNAFILLFTVVRCNSTNDNDSDDCNDNDNDSDNDNKNDIDNNNDNQIILKIE